MLSPKDQLKLDITIKAVGGVIKKKDACRILGKCPNTITRYCREYIKRGPLFLINGNKGHKGRTKNVHPQEKKEEVLKLISEKYYDFSVAHAWEKLSEDGLQFMGYRTLLRWCREKNFVKKIRKKRRKIHRARERMPQTGIMLQMDGSHHKWFGNQETCLIAAIDDADNEVPYAEFFPSETTLSCMKVLYNIIKIKGLPKVIYVDRAGWFGGTKRTDFSQFERACNELGIELIYAHTPEAKGRIERFWGTMQNRLIPEMRLAKIDNIKSANSFVKDHLKENYNQRFKVPPRMTETAYTPFSELFAKSALCTKEYRSIGRDNTFSYKSQKYLLLEPASLSGSLVEIRINVQGEMKFYFKDRKIEGQPIPSKNYKWAS